MAMLKVIDALGPVDKIYIDGICGPKLDQCHEFVKDGDNIIKEIGLASICAKVSRDNFMMQLAKTHPKYGWDKNMGYGTPAHIEAIKSGGLTEYHRRSYVKKLHQFD
jgi:ribonuclease HII